MHSLLCSVIIPAHNCLDCLPVALASAATQRAGSIEVIIIDDGSSDGTSAWLKERGRDWPALRVIELDGAGPARARNAGIEAARAPLIAFLDPASWWWPDKLARQLAYHEAHPETAFSFADQLHVSAAGESLGSCFEYWQPPLRRHKSGYARLPDAQQIILATNLVGISTVAASKASLERAGGFRNLASAEDWDCWLRLAAQAPVACSKAVTVTALTRPESEPARQLARIAAMGEIIAPYESSAASSIRQAAAKARARIGATEAELARSAGRHTSAVRYRSRAFMSPPGARLGKETPASFLNTALLFVSGLGAGK